MSCSRSPPKTACPSTAPNAGRSFCAAETCFIIVSPAVGLGGKCRHGGFDVCLQGNDEVICEVLQSPPEQQSKTTAETELGAARPASSVADECTDQIPANFDNGS